MRKVKVGLFFFGNIQNDARCNNMILSLSKNGYCVDAFHLAKTTQIKKNIKLIGLQNKHSKGFLKFYCWFKLIKKISLKPYSYIIASDLYSLAGLKINKKHFVIYDVRDFFNELTSLNNKPFKKMFWGFLEKRRLKFTNSIITTSPEDLKIVKNNFNSFGHLKYFTIYNFPYNYNIKKHNYLRDKFQINKKNKILIYQGILEKGRGVRLLVDVVAKTKDLVFIILGDGPDSLFLKEKVNLLKLNHKVFFHNRVAYKELLDITSSADFGAALIKPVSKNNIYALPNKLFEYSACGLPVLCSNMPSMTKTIKKYNLGEVVNVYDKRGLEFCLKKISNNLSFYNKRLLKNNLTWEKQEKKFLEIFSYKNNV